MSSEPTATFALTNSLAGLLAPWLVILLGLFWRAWRKGETPRIQLALMAVFALLIGACLVLTESRTAWLATLLGLVLLAAWMSFGKGGKARFGATGKLAIAAGGAVAVLVAAAVGAGAVDWEIIGRAPLSVLYRLQYWRATAAMIADHPLVGVGPGNFQDFYTTYKAPQALETIADPHNFLLEVGATAGIPALLLLMAVLAFAGWTVWNGRRSGVVETTQATSPLPLALYIGALAGFPLAIPAGLLIDTAPDAAVLWLCAPVAVLVLAGLHRWVLTGSLPPVVLLVGVVVLLVNLLAAGGISFPGVATFLWLLLAMSLNRAEADKPPRTAPRWTIGLFAVAAGALVLLCHQTGYGPVLRSQMLLSQGAAAEQAGRWDEAETSFLAAAEADRLSASPWREAARLAHRRWMRRPRSEHLQQFESYTDQLRRRAPRSSRIHQWIAARWLAIYSRSQDAEHLERAVEYCREAAQLYPNGAIVHARLAWSLQQADQPEQAAASANRAIRLDELNPHEERTLANRRLFDEFSVLAGRFDAASQSAAAWMEQLASSQ